MTADADVRLIVKLFVAGLILAAGALVLTGCAARQGYSSAPVVANLGGYVANQKAVLWQDAAGCHLVVTFADGQTSAQRLDAAICETGAAWVKAVASVPKPEVK